MAGYGNEGAGYAVLEYNKRCLFRIKEKLEERYRDINEYYHYNKTDWNDAIDCALAIVEEEGGK